METNWPLLSTWVLYWVLPPPVPCQYICITQPTTVDRPVMMYANCSIVTSDDKGASILKFVVEVAATAAATTNRVQCLGLLDGELDSRAPAQPGLEEIDSKK
uniref:Putative secreted protein n=1 Tax=Anopheles marajoara TaxID=58244 RepID=A0A2M4C8U3_9DIPT